MKKANERRCGLLIEAGCGCCRVPLWLAVSAIVLAFAFGIAFGLGWLVR